MLDLTGGKEILEAFHQKAQLAFACICCCHSKKQCLSSFNCRLQRSPLVLQIAFQNRFHFLGFYGEALLLLHCHSHLLEYPLASFNVLLLLVAGCLLFALHTLDHDIQRHAVHFGECNALAFVLSLHHTASGAHFVLVGTLLIQLLLTAFQVADEHAKHHRIAKHVLFIFLTRILVVLWYSKAVALPQLLEEFIEYTEALQAEACMRDRSLLLIGHILEPHAQHVLIQVFQV
mmetsp:Transcript_61194/g.111933  ORF Transcript_61194/g.111933 Transcript_61194/m.111933 type:complete len:232 (-) Transcript_61194:369-1064(-)